MCNSLPITWVQYLPDNDFLLTWLTQIDERLVDIGDDLTDYEDDVEKNSFNIYRGGWNVS